MLKLLQIAREPLQFNSCLWKIFKPTRIISAAFSSISNFSSIAAHAFLHLHVDNFFLLFHRDKDILRLYFPVHCAIDFIKSRNKKYPKKKPFFLGRVKRLRKAGNKLQIGDSVESPEVTNREHFVTASTKLLKIWRDFPFYPALLPLSMNKA